MEGPDGLLAHLNQQVVLLDVSSDKNREGNAPVKESDFPWLGRFEQILAHVFLRVPSCGQPTAAI